MVKVFRKIFGLILTISLAIGWPDSGHAETVIILSSDSLTSTTRTISGVRSTVKREHESVDYVSILISHNTKALAQQLDSIKAIKPDIILTVGSSATKIAKEHFPNTNVVFSSVMYPAMSGFVESLSIPGRKLTGASLDIPVDLQFRYFRQIIPDLKKIGVLYTKNTTPLIPSARVVASEMGLELVAIEVNGEKDLPPALDRLAGEVDGLWSLADPVLFSPQSTKYILLNALRRGLPLMGFSRNVVESGALFALDFDYKAIGRQAGGIVNLILNGKDPTRISVTTPDIIWFHYNENTASRMGIEIPPDLVAIAKEVYR